MDNKVHTQQNEEQNLGGQMESARTDSTHLKDQIRTIDTKIAQIEQDAPKYSALKDIRDNLLRLNDLDAAQLFWGSQYSQQQIDAQLQRLNKLITDYDEELANQRESRDQLTKRVKYIQAKIGVLNDEIIGFQQKLQERENEFVLVRDQTVASYRPMVMPWSGDKEDEKRYRIILIAFLCFSLLMGFVIPNWKLPPPDESKVVEIPKRIAELIMKKKKIKPKPPPKVEKLKEEKKKDKKKPKKDKSKPTKDEIKLARDKAVNSGILAFRDDFADLMDNSMDEKLGASANISNSGSRASQVQRNIVTAAGTGSGGINTSSISRGVRGTKSIGGITFSRVESGIGDVSKQDRKLSAGMAPSRTDEEIQIVFDRYKAALYRIYNRELRKNPTLQGKIVLRITIEPDGKVSACKMDSSELDEPILEAKIVDRVKKFNFGPKEGVKTITIIYPIDFLPAI